MPTQFIVFLVVGIVAGSILAGTLFLRFYRKYRSSVPRVEEAEDRAAQRYFDQLENRDAPRESGDGT